MKEDAVNRHLDACLQGKATTPPKQIAFGYGDTGHGGGYQF